MAESKLTRLFTHNVLKKYFTLFSQLPGRRGTGPSGWMIQAKLQVKKITETLLVSHKYFDPIISKFLDVLLAGLLQAQEELPQRSTTGLPSEKNSLFYLFRVLPSFLKKHIPFDRKVPPRLRLFDNLC